MSKLSVVIITLNEEEKIGRCIQSVQAVADEIIVVDSYSTDKTVEIATQLGAKVFLEKFEGYTRQKNIAVAHSHYDYVFSIDADEEISKELLRSIKAVKQQGFGVEAYEMNRLNFFGDRPIKTCGWYPDTKVRIWNKKKGGWQGGLVHEKWKSNNTTTHVSKQNLLGDLLHHSYQTTDDLKQQAENFAKLAAPQLKDKSLPVLVLNFLFNPISKFFKNYVLNKGFTDGKVGFYVCYYQYRETRLKYYEAIKLKYA